MANDMRTCKACGKEYQYCPKCRKYASLPSWMWKCDTEECNDIFNVISAYNMGNKTTEDIIEIVEKHNINDFSKFTTNISNILNDICANKKTNKKNKKKEMDIELVEEKPTEEIFEEILNEDSDVDINSEINGISDLI